MKLEGAVAIVTGGSSGLGLSACLHLKDKGAKVVMVDISTQGEKVAQQHHCHFIQCDVSNEEQVKNMVESVKQKYGKINVVVNSAGIIVAQPIVSSKGVASGDLMMKALKVNVMGTFNVSKYSALVMSKQTPTEQEGVMENGVIINVASVAGVEGQRGQTMYSATKGAILGMTLPMARDLGRFSIRVVTLAPGIFATPMGAQIPKHIVDTMNKMTPLGRPGQVHEFAHMVTSVAENTYLSGCVLRLDGAIRLAHL